MGNCIFGGGGDFCSAFDILLGIFDGGAVVSGGDEGLGFGVCPTCALEDGQIGFILDGGDDDVSAREDRSKVMGSVDADLELLVEFDALTGKGQFCTLAGLVYPVVQGFQFCVLRRSQGAKFAMGVLLLGELGVDLGIKGDCVAKIVGWQSRGEDRVGLGGAQDELGVVGKNANGDVDLAHGRYLW